MTEYGAPTVMQYGDCTIIVHRPILTEAERCKREKQVKEQLEAALKPYIMRKAAEGAEAQCSAG